MKKILVLGATGMAGHLVYLYLKKTGKYMMENIVYRNRLDENSIFCDVYNLEELKTTIIDVSPDIVINCIGALVAESKIHPENAIYLNAFLPNSLVSMCNKTGSKIIQLSTDCVFSGKDGNYTENSFQDADDVYGRSKALGELNVGNHLTLRTSIIGPELKERGAGLFDWFMQQSGKVRGYSQAYWGGVTTIELSKAIEKAIDAELSGLMHVTNGKRISKFELLSQINNIMRNSSLLIYPNDEYMVDKSLASSPQFDFKVPDYNEMLTEMKVWIDTHPIYKY